MPVEHHNAMEMFAATAVWEGDGRIAVYDKTQGPQNCRDCVANVFGRRQEKVRVLCPYVGVDSVQGCGRNTSCRLRFSPRWRSSAPCRWR